MKKSVSYKRLQQFDTLATNYLINNGYFTPAVPAKGDVPALPGGFTKKPATKLVENIKKIIKQTDKLYDGFAEEKADILLDNCLVDEKTKAILYDESKDDKGSIVRNYKFTVAQQKEVNKKIRELSLKEVEIHVRITEGDLDLTDEEREAFSGIVIPEQIPPPIEEE